MAKPLAKVVIVNIAHNNGFAMLGGQIVLFNGLLFRPPPRRGGGR
jgi:hypothetical protein